MKWRLECQFCAKARRELEMGIVLPCNEDKCEPETFNNTATTNSIPTKQFQLNKTIEVEGMTEREKIIKIIEKWAERMVITRVWGADVYDPYNAAELADALIADGIGDVAEWKRRAEVAERAVREYAVQVGCRSCPFYGRCGIACPSAMDYYKECYEAALRVSAREIEEKLK